MDITLVHGAPCAGKNEYVQGKMQEGDVIIDADLLAQALGSPDAHNHPGHIKSLGMKLRDVAIREASRGTYKTWVISASPRATQTIPHTSSLHLDPGMDVCLERAKTRPAWTKEAIRDYYDKLEIPEPSRFAKVQWLEVDMTLVYGTVTDVSGQPVPNARVYVALSSAGVSDDTIISTRRNVRANRYGYWEMDIIPNSSIEPAGTYYIVRHLNAKMFIVVPDTINPVPVNSIIASVPNNPLSTSTYVNDVGGYYGSIPAETIQAMVGAVGEGGGAVSSVDGRVGIVTLGDKYATLLHNHDGQYSGISHNHDTAYASLAHNHDASYSSLSHNHNDLYSVLGHSHANYSLNDHAHDEEYVRVGEETVTSVNGQTGDVVISGGGGGGAVDSVDGRTGVVTLDDLYAGASHDHDSSYAPLVNDYLEPGDEVVQSVDGRTGDITLDDLYSAAGHSHSYPVTSVDGQTGAVSLSSSYAAANHNHSGVYSPVAHNHDSSYSAIGHTHSYPVTSVDGLTGAVSLSSTYAAANHNHNSSYAALSHNHDASYAALSHNHDASYSALAHTHSITECFTFSHQGNVTTGAGTSRKYVQYAGTVVAVRTSVGTAPTGASLLVDVNKNGTTIFTTQSNRPSISASGFTASTTTVQAGTFSAGDYLTVDIDQIGSSVAGANLVVDVYYQRSQ